ncbi:unnamed protein product [Arabidopsis lyrata]|uniref:Predicted protein n=1 Tax=Arabidopsis lyrata subsp. lyrata TaxID=81972 RepID=D7MKQ7_ARALL|nr:predicted protein [Arabidopsis lyrata subsp. lyrata]CAH8280515.1 unnamed protein product [Arabidopsis lyrata]
MMKRRSRENNYNISSQRRRYREISTREKSRYINIPLDITVEILKFDRGCSMTHPQQRCDVQIIFHYQSDKSSFFIFAHPQNTDQEFVSIPGLTVDSYGYVRDDLFNHVFVFGYDPVKNRYKVVCLITKSEELENTFFLFSN